MTRNPLRETLRKLRASLSGKAEDAYRDRDAARSRSNEESFAAGEAHAYGDASDQVREAQDAEDRGA
jgi:hypothetical protein